jgi:SRSO17 transposase
LPGWGIPFGKLRTGLAHVGPRGRALVNKRLYLPEGWTQDPARCAAAEVPEAQRQYRAKTDLALEMLREARDRGYLSAPWVTGDDAFGMSPEFRDGLAAEGMQYVLEVPPNTPVWPLEPTWSSPAYPGTRAPSPSPATARGAPDHD